MEVLLQTVRHTWHELRQAHGDQLTGYALCTDDCLMTLFHSASTRDFCERRPTDAYLPTEWPLSDYHAWEPAVKLLAAREEAASAADRASRQSGEDTAEALSRHVDSSFACLVEALRQLQHEGVFGEGVFLTVLSTDPSEYLEDLQEGSVRALNPPAVLEGWKQAMGR